MGEHILYFFIYPGFLFTAVVGGIIAGVDRKLTAAVQFRKGPPILQPFYDFFKLLLVKETIVPANGSKITFLLAPVFALCGVSIAAVLILMPLLGVNSGFEGDIIVIFYLLTIPSLTYIIGAMASGNPLASVGASREMKLIIGYELTFLLVIAAIIYKSDLETGLYEILQAQQSGSSHIGSLSGVLLFIAGMFCVQAKLGLVPFDMGEAETEIAEGAFIEYSGSAFALIKLSKYMLFFILPALIILLLMGGVQLSGIHILWAILKLVAVVLLITLIRNTNPRLKINQAMRFFFVWMNALVVIAIVLSYFGY
ncbi:MAG TPA: complex I subunit 1 family protein [Salinivirga sp.]|uniref:respiratory chain complex I subunit 1 family protein n=1 Tax=Salinivirga sp. TaxID=1970192 RepID=UPI002B49C834|nr:complex I subunit 1 family protein [Salinivirga sp.]HKK58789.1 complex I subunit 1 family protein [Salinivirga sp.]